MRYLLILLVAGVVACESVHQGAREVGQPVGSATRLPGSVMEGAAEGVAGKPTPNPYNR
jgi:hypothetical protein